MVDNIGATAIRFTPDEVAELSAPVNQARLPGTFPVLLAGLIPRGTTEEIENEAMHYEHPKDGRGSGWRDEYMPC